MPEHVLDEQRAGFIGQDGIRIDIGLEHLTSVNGEVVYRSVLRALGPMDGADAQPREALEKIAVLTSIGEGGIYSQLSDGGGWTTAIQNSLDGQSIEHRVVVDLQLSNLPTLRSDLGRALERQLADAISSF